MKNIILMLIAILLVGMLFEFIEANKISKEELNISVSNYMNEQCKKFPKMSMHVLDEWITCWDIDENYEPLDY